MKQCLGCCLAVLLSIGFSPLSSVGQSLDGDILEVKVKGVTIDPQSNTPVVILEEQQGHRAFPMWIGLPEARAIMLRHGRGSYSTPINACAFAQYFGDLHVNIGRVIITDMQDDTFYATILLRQGNNTLTIDARPSDAIALALHSQAPVFATKKLLDAVRTVTLQEPPPFSAVVKTLGMHIQTLDATLAGFFHLAKAGGVLVSSVAAGSQAEKHGMRRGDVITSVDGKPVRDIQDFLTTCKEKKVGQERLFQVSRDRNPLKIRLVCSSLDEGTRR